MRTVNRRSHFRDTQSYFVEDVLEMRSALELMWFFVRRRKFVMLPLIFIMIVLSSLFILGSNPAVTPFIYALF